MSIKSARIYLKSIVCVSSTNWEIIKGKNDDNCFVSQTKWYSTGGGEWGVFMISIITRN